MLKLVQYLIAKGHLVKKSKSQSGSAHLIIIIILVLALLGSLGFVFWQNFMQVKSGTVAITTTAVKPSEIALTKIAYDKTTASGLAIKYPKTWVLSNSNGVINGLQNDKTTITSPDGNVSINFDVQIIGGYGGYCAASEDNSEVVELVKLDTDTIPGYPNARFADYATHNSLTGTYNYFVGAQSITDHLLTIQVGYKTAMCDPFGLGSSAPIIIDRNDGQSLKPELKLTVTLPGIQNGVSSLSDFNKAIATDNFTIAKRIVQSLYIK